MKTLSIKQPWAYLIVSGAKDLENRTWQTKHRGPLAIHASGNFAWDFFEFAAEDARLDPFVEKVKEHFGIVGKKITKNSQEIGAIVGTVTLADVIDTEFDESVDDNPWWSGDDYAFILSDPKAITPIPAKGKLFLWEFEL